MQEQANKLLAEIGEKFNLSKSESVRFFEIFQGLANNAKTEEKPAIVQEAIEQAKLNIGETPVLLKKLSLKLRRASSLLRTRLKCLPRFIIKLN